jgi:hypothetical protein
MDGWKDRLPMFAPSSAPPPQASNSELTEDDEDVIESIVRDLLRAAEKKGSTITITGKQTSLIPKIIRSIEIRKANSTGNAAGTEISTKDAVTYLKSLQGSSTLTVNNPGVFGKLANKIVAAAFPDEPLPWSRGDIIRTNQTRWFGERTGAGRKKSRKLGNTFNRCVKSVRSTVRARKGSTKESAAIAICTKSVLQTRGRTMKRYRKGRLITQKKFRGGGWGTCS